MSKYKPKTKRLTDNYRIEVTIAEPWFLIGTIEENHDKRLYALKSTMSDILRHIDDVENIQVEWDDRKICVYCDEPFDSAFDPISGEPGCCEKAVNDFEAYRKELEDKP